MASAMERAQQDLALVGLPVKAQVSFGPYRCRLRALGNTDRFAIALTVFIGRVPFSAEDRAGRTTLLSLDDASLAGVGKISIKADNWVTVTCRHGVLHPPTRANVATAIVDRLARMRQALDALAQTAISPGG